MADSATKQQGKPTVVTDGAGFTAAIYDTNDPAQRAALHAVWAPSAEEKAKWRTAALRRELLSLCAQFGTIHAVNRTLPQDAPQWAVKRMAEIKAELEAAASKARAA